MIALVHFFKARQHTRPEEVQGIQVRRQMRHVFDVCIQFD